MQPLLVRLSACIAAILCGLFLFGLGLVIALVAGSRWLYLSLAGVIMAIVAGALLIRLVKRFKQSLTQATRIHVRARLRK